MRGVNICTPYLDLGSIHFNVKINGNQNRQRILAFMPLETQSPELQVGNIYDNLIVRYPLESLIS